MRGVAHGSGDIMGDHDDREPLVAVQRRHKLVHFRRDFGVETGHGLVEHDQLARGTERAGEKHALLLSSREFAVAMASQRRQVEALHVPRRQFLFPARVERAQPHAVQAARQHDLPDAGGKIFLHEGLLGKVADLGPFQPFTGDDASPPQPDQTEDGLHQRTFAGAVFADDVEIVAALDGEVQPFHDGRVFVADGDIFAGKQSHGGLPVLVERFAQRGKVVLHERKVGHAAFQIPGGAGLHGS